MDTNVKHLHYAQQIHLWHVATGINSLIALAGYYYFLEPAPRNLLRGVWTEHVITRGLRTFTFVRGLISIYTIFVGILLTISAASFVRWPEWSWQFLPT